MGIPMQKTLLAVWLNTFNVTNAINVYGALGKHAQELNKYHASFWGLTQRFSMNSAVMSICKLYDVSNKHFIKNTVPRLFNYLEDNLQITNAPSIQAERLIKIGVPADTASEIVLRLNKRDTFDAAKKEMLAEILSHLPSAKSDKSLKRIFTVRNKSLAHQEELDNVLEEQVKFLPSLEEMERLNNWAIHFCELLSDVFNQQLPVTSKCSHMATKNVIKKFLGLNFDDPSLTEMDNFEARKRFYAKD